MNIFYKVSDLFCSEVSPSAPWVSEGWTLIDQSGRLNQTDESEPSNMDTGYFTSKSFLFLFKFTSASYNFGHLKGFNIQKTSKNILIKDRIIDGDFSDLDALSCYCGFQTGVGSSGGWSNTEKGCKMIFNNNY